MTSIQLGVPTRLAEGQQLPRPQAGEVQQGGQGAEIPHPV